MSRVIGLLFILLVLLVGVAFHLGNDQPVALNYFLATVELPFSLWLLLALALGAVLGLLACLPGLVSGRLQIGRLRRRVQGLEAREQNPPQTPGAGG
ncbi:MAG: DUF1049 domain-containing protein [Gammaproteobacteria bacterium]|nr:DUF1049 domain-containing protein [Gammaproteobacteria bacterium]